MYWYNVWEKENKDRGTVQYAKSARQARRIVAKNYGYDMRMLSARKMKGN